MSKKLVTTARGKLLNMEALKASQPNTVPVGNIISRQTKEDAPITRKPVKNKIRRVRASRPIKLNPPSPVESQPEEQPILTPSKRGRTQGN